MGTIFVGGAMRTGTTVLQSVLCSGRETNPVINEAHFFTHLMGLYRYGLANYERQLDGHYFDSLTDYARFMGGVALEFLERTRRRYAPATTLVLKSPEMTMLFPLVGRLFPDARFVVSVRDPRDTIASVIEAAERQRARGIDSAITAMGRDMHALSAHFKGLYGPVFNSDDAGFLARVHVVRYEDLVAEPEAVAGRLRAFTGLALESFAPDRAWARNAVDFQAQEAAGEPFASKLRGGPVSDASVGRYRRDLSDDERAVVEAECRPIMEHFGYPAGRQP